MPDSPEKIQDITTGFYNKGILQNMYKLARKFVDSNSDLSDNFQKPGNLPKYHLSTKIPDELGFDLKTLEGQLLGMLLLKEGQIIPVIQAILTADDFYYPDYKVIYKIIVDLYNRRIIPNLISVIEELKVTDQFSNQMLKSVINIGEIAFSNIYAKDHATKIKGYST